MEPAAIDALVDAYEHRIGPCNGARAPPAAVPRVARRGQVAALIARGTPFERPADTPARFGVGDRMVARNMPPRATPGCRATRAGSTA